MGMGKVSLQTEGATSEHERWPLQPFKGQPSGTITLQTFVRGLLGTYQDTSEGGEAGSKTVDWRHRTRLRSVSLFSWSIKQNARDTQMTLWVT